MPAADWTDARIAAAETGIPAGDVLGHCFRLVLTRAGRARTLDGDKRPCPDFILGCTLLLADMGSLDKEEADRRIALWAEKRPVPLDKSAGDRNTLNRLADLAG
ncbi:MAG: hypothetical protein AB1916_03025 [Thermodesulfobacteriota bacterium]